MKKYTHINQTKLLYWNFGDNISFYLKGCTKKVKKLKLSLIAKNLPLWTLEKKKKSTITRKFQI